MFSIIITNIEQSSQFIQKIKLLGHKIILKVLKISKPALQYAEESQALFLYMPIHTHTHYTNTYTHTQLKGTALIDCHRLSPEIAPTQTLWPRRAIRRWRLFCIARTEALLLYGHAVRQGRHDSKKRERGEKRRGDALSSWTMGLSLLLMRSRCSSRFIGLLSISHVPR